MLRTAGERLLTGRITASKALSGGDLSELLLVTMEDGRKAVLKGGPKPRTEAAMLEAISGSGAPTPAVLGVDDELSPSNGSPRTKIGKRPGEALGERSRRFTRGREPIMAGRILMPSAMWPSTTVRRAIGRASSPSEGSWCMCPTSPPIWPGGSKSSVQPSMTDCPRPQGPRFCMGIAGRAISSSRRDALRG